MDLSQVSIIGTSHIAKESVKEIGDYIDSRHIDVVCVELDKDRLLALQQKKKQRIKVRNIGMIKEIGFTGFIFALIASASQKQMGEKVKTQAGSDMLAAVKSAAKREIPVALIDQNVTTTLRKLSKEVSFREKMRLVGDMIKGLFGIKSALTELSMDDIDLKKVPSDKVIETVLKKTRHRYPGLYDVLVEDRNRFMAKRIITLMKKHPDWKLLVVIGAGHKEGLVRELEKRANDSYKDHFQNVYSSTYLHE
jgi:pheromone shutdown protein TraB